MVQPFQQDQQNQAAQACNQERKVRGTADGNACGVFRACRQSCGDKKSSAAWQQERAGDYMRQERFKVYCGAAAGPLHDKGFADAEDLQRNIEAAGTDQVHNKVRSPWEIA